MSKSLGNYIGIDEPAAEMFGKVMSISDELMWRYYELLTDRSVEEIEALRKSTAEGDSNPRDLKAALAKQIIADFHSEEAAIRAEEEFRRIFTLKEMPGEIEERLIPSGTWELKHLLVTLGLASSKAEARRLIEQGGVSVDGVRSDPKVNSVYALQPNHPGYDIKVGKRRYVRVRGE
jgi:tyrosyl-tRNA synthetase